MPAPPDPAGPQPTPADFQALVDGLQRDVERLMTGLPELRRRAEELRVTHTSDDGLVTVTVDQRAQLVDVVFDPRIYRAPDSRGLAQALLGAVWAATAEATRQVEDILTEYLPSGVKVRELLEEDIAAALERPVRRVRGAR
ncbi:YbaB/EbfC family nucleoid-associated protein [Dactylosporangium sp. AC04546]|uniref:YbaB/EbfC family nucleoid-associated protein n=1 Tax=Dactylosporangium sp. AC04546 TaxID=2862460 RepID=UPI001EDF608E|nr:YbaB/EbfC family nucleoid-associated protein [Dactylosporangium sp. AC04546]WVK89098.1 YbaB/EbfC family nucleoid-associated protein [Dactylosporangium sp. AC04546]